MERRSTCRLMAAMVCALSIGLLAAGCGSASSGSNSSSETEPVSESAEDHIEPTAVNAPDRTYGIVTTACGDASATQGTGVALGAGRVLTSAHVVIGSSSLVVLTPAGTEFPAQIVAVDTKRDLALLQITDDGLEPVNMVGLDQAETATVQTRDGPVRVEVAQALVLDVFEVRGSGRSERRGFRLEGETSSGDSGSGLFTEQGLAGSVFATTTSDDRTTWATAASEVEAFLTQGVDSTYVCDSEQSRIIEQP